jgi:triacylglycerol lipase
MKRKIITGTAKLCLIVSTLFAASASFAAHDPVIIIPGMGGDPSYMITGVNSFKSAGWTNVEAWTDADKMNVDMEKSAAAISAKVDQVLANTGAKKVTLYTWSASTIAARYYIKNLGGAAKVRTYVGVAGPQHGISIWRQCSAAPACTNQWGPNNPVTPWLANLNSGTEVPGSPSVAYLTIRSTADANATPYDTAILSGAENFLISGAMAPTHFTIPNDSAALAKAQDFITKSEARGDGPTTTTTTVGGTTTTTQQCTAANTPAVTKHLPIIMIPGMLGNTQNAQPQKDYLVQNGWDANQIYLWKDSSNMAGKVESVAAELSQKVDDVLRETGASKVIITGHSAGAIAGRYYIKNLGGISKTLAYVGLAGPQHGTSNWQSCFAQYLSCKQWGPAPAPGNFLGTLNSPTEVPGAPAVSYLTIHGTADTNAMPPETAILAGAENVTYDGLDHYGILKDARALEKVRSFIVQAEGGTGGTCGSTTTTTAATTTTTSTTTTTTLGSNCYTSSNSAHVAAGRATDTFGFAYAKGSYQYMGFDNSFFTTSLKQLGSSYYVVPMCY